MGDIGTTSVVAKAMAEARLYSDAYETTAFLQALEREALPEQAFKRYLVQDSLYLRQYLKCFGYGIVKSRTWKERQFFYRALGYVTDEENKTRLAYLETFGLDDAAIDEMESEPVCAAYGRYLLTVAEQGTVEDIIMVTMPCMIGYYDVFTALAKRTPQAVHGRYGAMIRDYTSTAYQELIRQWQYYAATMCDTLSAERQAQLIHHFKKASSYELAFWQMLGEAL